MVKENLRVFKDAGFISPRAGIRWHNWETKRGVYKPNEYYSMYIDYMEQATALGLMPMQTITSSNPIYEKGYPKSREAIEAFAGFCEYVVQKYKGKCYLYKIWNEWDRGGGVSREFRGQGDAASYVRLAAAAYPRMKAVDPSITVIANSVCTGEKFFEQTLKEGILNHCDGVAFHSYHYRLPGDARKPEAYIKRIKGIARLLLKYNDGKDFPLYLTETGWPNFTKRGGSTDEETADYIARTFLLVKTIPSVKGLWWYGFQDDGLNPEHNEDNFGIVRTDLTPKPAFYVMRSIAEIVRKGRFVEKMKSPDDGLVALKFKMPDGRDVLAAWSVVDSVNMSVTLNSPGIPKDTLMVFFAGYEPLERDWGMREWTANRNAPFIPDAFQFTVKSRPFIVIGDLTSISIAQVKRIAFSDVSAGTGGKPQIPARVGSSRPVGKNPVKYALGNPENYRSLSSKVYGGSSDIDAGFYVSWEKDALTLCVEVMDNIHEQDEAIDGMWSGDCVQVAFQSFDKKADSQLYSEYTLGLNKGKSLVYREISQLKQPAGLAKNVSLNVKREGNKTICMARFPVSELGLPSLKDGMIFGFSLLVNDCDKKVRKGYLRWGDGIGSGKDPSAYNWIRIEE
ncbi:MAG: hypothetical protein JXR78_01415 [Victivallales bacterium]|nr:hypothetical protein [Victivallales bacterium]